MVLPILVYTSRMPQAAVAAADTLSPAPDSECFTEGILSFNGTDDKVSDRDDSYALTLEDVRVQLPGVEQAGWGRQERWSKQGRWRNGHA